jgi:probable HAF family extracellular repeat protein
MRNAGLLAFLFAIASVALAQGTFIQIDFPGAGQTQAWGVNAAGDIVGLYVDSADNEHGFFLSKGRYATVDYPGAYYTHPSGINDTGQIVGYTFPANVGFIFDVRGQTFTSLSDPEALETEASCINNEGVVGGGVVEGNSTNGFELADSAYRIVSPPDSGEYSFVVGITGSDELIIETTSGTNYVPYLFSRNTYSKISIPPELAGGLVQGVNPAGTAFVGYYSRPTGRAGYVLRDGKGLILQFPGSNYTVALGINGSGEVVGYFLDSGSHVHGFTWMPAASAADK